MSYAVKGTSVAIAVAALVSAYAISHAKGAPAARSAAANTMIATITNSTPPDAGREVYVTITGQIQAPSHKFAPRRCRSSRVVDIESPSIGGAVLQIGSSYPTTKSGHFKVEFAIDYGGTDEDGFFNDGSVPYSGGTATYALSTGKVKVQKVKGDFRTHTCRPLRLTVQFAAPPAPGY